MDIAQLHAELMSIVSRLIYQSEHKKLTHGRDLIDFPPDDLILTTAYFTPSDDSSVEVSTTEEMARPEFEWLAEITVKEPENIEHYLLRPDSTIVETYGKNVFDVSLAQAKSLRTRLLGLIKR